jgi:hypothetical protein
MTVGSAAGWGVTAVVGSSTVVPIMSLRLGG